MRIFSQFDSGNIRVLNDSDINNIQLAIHHDNQSEFYQWFHFRLEADVDQAHTLHIQQLAGSAYPEGWKDYQAVASYDRDTWFRVPTEFDGDTLTIKVTPQHGSMYFAYFAPYSYERHLDLIHQAQTYPQCQLETLGQTLDGRDISLLKIRADLSESTQPKTPIWLIARQHPGESMAEWFMEGLLDRLLDDTDTTAQALLEKADFYVVPNMNPDGSVRGHLRTNAVGANLNREWQSPTLERSPEVYHVRARMEQTGVKMCLDIHGDEAIPYNFVAGCEGIPSYDARMADLEDRFKRTLLTVTPEFQDEHGYEKDAPGKANLTVGSNWIGERFNCLSYTVEMPFKDHNNHPDPDFGWSPARSQAFGRDMLSAILGVVDGL